MLLSMEFAFCQSLYTPELHRRDLNASLPQPLSETIPPYTMPPDRWAKRRNRSTSPAPCIGSKHTKYLYKPQNPRNFVKIRPIQFTERWEELLFLAKDRSTDADLEPLPCARLLITSNSPRCVPASPLFSRTDTFV